MAVAVVAMVLLFPQLVAAAALVGVAGGPASGSSPAAAATQSLKVEPTLYAPSARLKKGLSGSSKESAMRWTS